jgi:hypothetical protein
MAMESSRPSKWTARIAILGWLLLLVAVADWVALKTGVAPHSPPLLATIVALAMGAFAVRIGHLLILLSSARRGRVKRSAELVLLLGLLASLLSGTANWALSLQGFVVLNEREKVRLH